MEISRDNYEEFFFLYLDNELSPGDRAALQAFLTRHPDLAAELAQMQQLTLRPDLTRKFPGKERLLRPEEPGLVITESNCEEYFLLYADNELNNAEKALVENFVYHNPRFQAGFELIQLASFSPDQSIVFPDKEQLYRREQGRRVIPLRRWMTAAAILLLLAGLFWLNRTRPVRDIARIHRGQTRTPAPPASAVVPGTPGNSPEKQAEENPPSGQQIAANPETGEKQTLARGAQKGSLIKAGRKKGSRPENTNSPAYTQEALAANSRSGRPEMPSIIRNDDVAGIDLPPAAEAVAALRTPPDRPQPKEPAAAGPAAAAMETPDPENKIAILNTEVRKPASLRGVLRKASRFIAKKTSREENGNRGGIHIGGFEIAVR